ncbi:MAG TPA: Ldh family oxidoreductase [Fimbriiglobus sp.]
MPTFAPAPLTAFAAELLEAVQVPPTDAKTVAGHLVNANLCGHDSHGVMRVPQYVGFLKDGTYKANASFQIEHETPAAIAVDGEWGLGQVQAHRLLDRLFPKAKSMGVAAGSIKQCGHVGRLGAYAEAAAEQGFVFFGTVNSHGAGKRVAPPGGTEGRISTNPICLGSPTSGPPVVLDFGTSVAAEGKVRVHYQKNEPTPEGWLIDHEGQPTTDPGVLYREPHGTILPFGGTQAYKGFGLGLLLDLFTGALSGGRCANATAPINGTGNAVLFTLYDPAAFGGAEHFLRQASELVGFVRSCPTAPGVKGITLPGDPERSALAARQQSGITIPDGTWTLLTKIAAELNVQIPS